MMNYEEMLKSIQQEVRTKIDFKKDVRTVELLEEYTEAYEQHMMENAGTFQAGGEDDADRLFHRRILDFVGEIIAKDLRTRSTADQVTRQIAGTAYAIMGKCYLRGIFGSVRDAEAAVDSFSRSVACRNPVGMFELARCFELGIGVDRDPENACMLYRASYKLGYSKSLHRYAQLLIKGSQYVPRNILDGHYILRQATLAKERIYISPYYDLAMLHRSGICDIFNDPHYAFEIFTIGANKGCRHCQFKLGEEWQAGEVVARDLSKAFFWYRVSAQNNLSDAQLKVARFLYGVEATSRGMMGVLAEGQLDLQSLSRATKRHGMTELELAVRKKPLLDFHRIYGAGFDRLGEGYSMALRSAKSGNVEAMLLVAEALENGFGAERSILESLWWYRIAEALGDDDVGEKIHLLESRLGRSG